MRLQDVTADSKFNPAVLASMPHEEVAALIQRREALKAERGRQALPAEIGPDTPFTRDTLAAMDEQEMLDFWRKQQRALRAAGREYADHLTDATTGKLVARIDDPISTPYYDAK